jgi:hypothetical protein
MKSAPSRRAANPLLAPFAIGRSGQRQRSSAGSARRRFRTVTAAALVGTSLLAVAGTQALGAGAASAASFRPSGTGFKAPFSGPLQFEYLAPTELTRSSQLNQPLGQQKADYIARNLGLRKSNSLTHQQYLKFIAGQGNNGDLASAKLVDESVAILTNTNGRPLFSNVNGVITPSVLASYGLYVNTKGQLQSPANASAPTRQINALLAPRGYLNKWMLTNGAARSLAQLYASPYVVEAAYGFVSQQISGAAQLVTNTKGRVSVKVGMSMAPALWIVNFILIYLLNPTLAASMPAYWAPIPTPVADAILASPTGQVPYSQYQQYLS